MLLIGFFFLAATMLAAARPCHAAPARIATCVNLVAPQELKTGLKLLVRSELDAHRTHRGVDENCESFLVIEWVQIPGHGGWITGRINSQVPHRESLAPGVQVAVERLLKVLLHNDPIRLDGPAQHGLFERSQKQLEQGRAVWEAEIVQGVSWLGAGMQPLPGGALGARREGDTLQLGSRIAGIFAMAPPPGELHMDWRLTLELDAMFWAGPASVSTWFAGPVLGYELVRFQGPALALGDGQSAAHVHHGPFAGARAGFEGLRHADVRFLFWGEVALPLFPVNDTEAGVLRHWVPTALLSAGLCF